MQLFRHENRERDAKSRRVYARYEIAHTVVDFLAALSFLIGSILFFWQSVEPVAIWMFVIGSAFFMAKPSLRLAREVQLWRMGQIDTLAQRASG